MVSSYTKDELAPRIDHTVLGPTTTQADVRTLVKEANKFGMNVCVPPNYVNLASDLVRQGKVATVISFPHGNTPLPAKVKEAEIAEINGADEIDVVANISAIKNGEFHIVEEEVRNLKLTFQGTIKIIIETGLLDTQEIEQATRAVMDGGAHFVKTCTGFNDGHARIKDVERMSDYLPVKASGGISDYQRACEFLDAGAERIGASSGAEILRRTPDTRQQTS